MTAARLSDVILSSDPEAKLEDGWSAVTLRICDVDKLEAGPTSWQVKVNRSRVGPGTVGWIHRWREGGRLAALIRFTGEPYPQKEPNGVIYYCEGLLHHLVEPVPSHQITQAPGWTNKAPYTTNRAKRFNDGVVLKAQEVAVLTSLLSAEDRAWLGRANQT